MDTTWPSSQTRTTATTTSHTRETFSLMPTASDHPLYRLSLALERLGYKIVPVAP
jgi:hypothetical protein